MEHGEVAPAIRIASYAAWVTKLTSDEQRTVAAIRQRECERLRAKYGIDPSMPGWIGWLQASTRELFERETALESAGQDDAQEPESRAENQETQFAEEQATLQQACLFG